MQIKLNESTLGQEEIDAVMNLFTRQTLTMGQTCLEFEKAFANYIGVKHAVMVNSGSSANLLAFFALVNPLIDEFNLLPSVEVGSEIIVPALTWSTSVWPIIQIGCVPVFVDSDPMTLQMNLEALEAAITPKTRAICAPHILGNAIHLPNLKKIAEKHNLWLIEDSCEALGVKNNQHYAGTLGHFGTYSFYFSHHITTIEGGMIVTNHDQVADLLRCMRAHGWIRHMENPTLTAEKHPEIDPRFLFISTGFNVRPTDISAAIGLIQLKKLLSFNDRRNKIADTWNQALKPFTEQKLITPMQITSQTEPAYFGYPVLCQDKKTKLALQNHLEKNNIETRPIVCGNLTRQPALKKLNYRISRHLNGADQVMDTGIYWGLHPLTPEDQINYLIKTIKDFFHD